ncbi:MAG: class I SAM-dependent methyltransferase [Candidatus Micrarchaeota archaeon]|nr:class I SAM-dependent methyltransferase [Candidatus Micrarchaeota archaeon]
MKKELTQKGTTPEELHYNYYSAEKYEDDIRRAIPGYGEMHTGIKKALATEFGAKKITVLELGIGTGLTAQVVLDNVNVGKYLGIDFSQSMLNGARKRLERYPVELELGDYAAVDFPKENGLVISVISIHHQATPRDKKKLFKKIYKCLSADGIFLFGDLFTQRNEHEAALNEAYHFHHLVENAVDEKTLAEWAHHYKFVNHLAAIEDQIKWLKQAGFTDVEVLYSKFNTAAIIAKKGG